MAMKFISSSLISILVVVLVAAQGEAQFAPVIPGINLISVVNVTGVVNCSVNATIPATAPPFPNALVQLVCGGNVIASAVTNQAGVFSIIVNQALTIINNFLSSCRVVVATPLVSCNATLPSNGTLQAPIRFVGNTVRGILNVTNAVPNTFSLNIRV